MQYISIIKCVSDCLNSTKKNLKILSTFVMVVLLITGFNLIYLANEEKDIDIMKQYLVPGIQDNKEYGTCKVVDINYITFDCFNNSKCVIPVVNVLFNNYIRTSITITPAATNNSTNKYISLYGEYSCSAWNNNFILNYNPIMIYDSGKFSIGIVFMIVVCILFCINCKYL